MPATARRSKKLRAFHGPQAERAAYLSGRFLAAALFGHAASLEWCRANGVRQALSTGDNSKGGFLVPDEFEAAVIDLREEYGVFRREARVRPMSRDHLVLPRRTSGLTAYFVSDNQEVTASDKSWDNVTLTARKVAALCKYSSELDEDAIIDLADDLAQEIAYAFANKEDECGFNGDATSTYGGITGVKNALNAGSKYTAITGNTAFSTLDIDDFEAMVGKLPLFAHANAKWYISQAGWGNSMLRLAEAAGGNTTREVTGGVERMFLGYPVVIAQVMNSTTSAQTSTDGLVYFGDLRPPAPCDPAPEPLPHHARQRAGGRHRARTAPSAGRPVASPPGVRSR